MTQRRGPECLKEPPSTTSPGEPTPEHCGPDVFPDRQGRWRWRSRLQSQEVGRSECQFQPWVCALTSSERLGLRTNEREPAYLPPSGQVKAWVQSTSLAFPACLNSFFSVKPFPLRVWAGHGASSGCDLKLHTILPLWTQVVTSGLQHLFSVSPPPPPQSLLRKKHYTDKVWGLVPKG